MPSDRTSDRTNDATRQDWRELGFFYDRDDQTRVWKLTGSRAGLLRFRDALLSYVSDPRHALKSEHEHYGPYLVLEVMTWPEAGFDDHAIRGSLADLERLAKLIEAKIITASPGSTVLIREEFVPDSPYALALDLREDGFDPATADPLLPTESARHCSTHNARELSCYKPPLFRLADEPGPDQRLIEFVLLIAMFDLA